MNVDDLVADLSPFADLGEEPPHSFMHDGNVIIRMIRRGEASTLIFKPDVIVEETGDVERRFKSISALLASPSFCDLARWADSQQTFLSKIVASETLTVTGEHGGQFGLDAVETLDRLLAQGKTSVRRNALIVLDGPAGIGKTSIIRKLSFERARSFRTRQLPLILHVESRGRVLQNLTDLMAFSLQSLRLSVIYDQVPVLIKHGLVTLAIDGFDELADPNGYDLAWSQLNSFIDTTRGLGSYILSGRETFISGSRIEKALPALNLELDDLATITVSTVAPGVARSWLKGQGWSDDALDSPNARPLLEPGSYALRPVFLRQLGSSEIANNISAGVIDDTLGFLVDAMLNREQRKFGADVEMATTVAQRRQFINDLMEEVARDLAENQTDAISSETLAWLFDTVSISLPPGVQGILRNRADVIAFLTNDERPGYRKFVHDEIQNLFLAQVTIRAVRNLEVPKYVHRNIFGLDFLANFADVIRYRGPGEINGFVSAASRSLALLTDYDRAKRNLATLIIATCSVCDVAGDTEISDVSIDEALMLETVAPIKLSRVTVAQLDARGADFRSVNFASSSLVTLIANSATLPSQSLPTPTVLAIPGATKTAPSEIEAWLGGRYVDNLDDLPTVSLRDLLAKYPLFNLLARLTRYRPFWLKDGEEKAARRILDDPYWPELLATLQKYDLILERDDVQASGRNSTFYHLRNKDVLLDLDRPTGEVWQMIRDLLMQSRDKQS